MPRRSSVTSRPATSTPSSRIRPFVGSISRFTILSDVVLPQPDGPTRTQILPAGIDSVRSLTAPGVPAFAARGSYVFVTWSNSTVAACGVAASGIGSPAMARGYAITATAPNLATDRFPARHLVPVPFVRGSGSFAPRRTTRHPRSDGSPWFERPGTCTDNDVPLRSCGRPARDLDG